MRIDEPAIGVKRGPHAEMISYRATRVALLRPCKRGEVQCPGVVPLAPGLPHGTSPGEHGIRGWEVCEMVIGMAGYGFAVGVDSTARASIAYWTARRIQTSHGQRIQSERVDLVTRIPAVSTSPDKKAVSGLVEYATAPVLRNGRATFDAS